MRTSRRTILAFVLGALPLAPAFGFDGTPVNSPVKPSAPLGVVSPQPVTAAPLANKPAPPAAVPAAVPAATSAQSSSVPALEYAAEGGHPVAQWKLGRMYAAGDGVVQNDLRAFEYFSLVANQHAEDNPGAPEAALVANAFVALGRYYLSGIPNTKVKADPERAREMFKYAASYFGNADAQYDLARLYLKDAGSSPENFRNGTRWLGLAAQKGQVQAQALLGQMLFNGDQMPPQRARGLMWLTLAGANAGADEVWIKESLSRATAKASESDRAMAFQMLEHWVKGRRD
jgi:TPR repeat protein